MDMAVPFSILLLASHSDLTLKSYLVVASTIFPLVLGLSQRTTVLAKRNNGGIDGATVLNFVLVLEHIETAFYSEGLSKFSEADFATAGFRSDVRGWYQQILAHEQAHVEMIDELANWPGISLFFVPLIPARFMTRTFNNVISLSGMYFMWPKVPPLPVQERLLENSTRIDHTVPAYQPHKSSWPPRLTQFGGIVTVTSIVYTMIFNRLTRWVLDLRPPERPGRPARPRRRARRRLTQNWDVNLGIGDADEDQRRQPPPRPAPAPEAEEDDDDDDPRIARLEGATGSRHSKIFTGLFIPLIAKGIGHLLYLTSMHYAPLRYILGIRSPDFPGSSPPKLVPEFTSSVHRTWYWQWFTEETIDHMDPVWIRNTIGLGIWVVGRDCLHLFHLWLAKKELASRRLKNRDFAGIDTTQLDLLPRST
uniref:Uncharacterized protein n=1 Tax=Moniliophthora roreri TaxID=221103 RepID=A0A0W0EYM9_MONRR